MSRKTDTVVARTIGIDTGKNTLHLIGLDDKGAVVLGFGISGGTDSRSRLPCKKARTPPYSRAHPHRPSGSVKIA